MKDYKYDINYWKTFDWKKITMQHSDFAEFCYTYMMPHESVLDICNGNGRDSVFFEEKGLEVTSFDFGILNLEDRIPLFNLKEKFKHVYCRFVLHCLPERLEDYILINSNKILENHGLLYIEARSDKGIIEDSLDTHYRRFINKEDLKNKLERLNFKIISEKESADLSEYNNENPVLIRIVAEKFGDIVTRGMLQDEKKTYCPLNVLTSYYLLTTVKRIFQENNITFFLLFGTLLGAYRDKGFIKGDTDIDLGLFEKDKEKVMCLINDGYFAIYGFLFIREWHGKDHLKALQYKTDYIDF